MLLKNELKYFIEIAEQLSLTRAADRLGVKQSALSKGLMKLELELEQKLFTRHSRGLALTECGQVLLRNCYKILNQWQQTQAELTAATNEISGNFRLGCHTIFADKVVPVVLKQCVLKTPIAVKFEFGSSRANLEKISKSQLDLGIIADPIPHPDLIIKKLWSEYIGLYSNDGLKQNCLLYHGKMINVARVLRDIGQIQWQEVSDYTIIYESLKTCSAMGLLPNTIGEKEQKRLKLIKKFAPPIELCLVYRADRNPSKAFGYLVTCLTKYLKPNQRPN